MSRSTRKFLLACCALLGAGHLLTDSVKATIATVRFVPQAIAYSQSCNTAQADADALAHGPHASPWTSKLRTKVLDACGNTLVWYVGPRSGQIVSIIDSTLTGPYLAIHQL